MLFATFYGWFALTLNIGVLRMIFVISQDLFFRRKEKSCVLMSARIFYVSAYIAHAMLEGTAFKSGNGISKDCKYLQNPPPYFDERQIIHEIEKITPAQTLSKKTASFQTAS